MTPFAAVHGAFEALGISPQEAMTAYGNLILELTEPEHFPHVCGLIAAGVFEQDRCTDGESRRDGCGVLDSCLLWSGTFRSRTRIAGRM